MILAKLRIRPRTPNVLSHCYEKQGIKTRGGVRQKMAISTSHASQISRHSPEDWYTGLLLYTFLTNVKVLHHYAGPLLLSRSTPMHVYHHYLGLSSLCRSFFIIHVHSTLTKNHSLIEENLHYILVVDEI
jgi:hypothetical protein